MAGPDERWVFPSASELEAALATAIARGGPADPDAIVARYLGREHDAPPAVLVAQVELVGELSAALARPAPRELALGVALAAAGQGSEPLRRRSPGRAVVGRLHDDAFARHLERWTRAAGRPVAKSVVARSRLGQRALAAWGRGSIAAAARIAREVLALDVVVDRPGPDQPQPADRDAEAALAQRLVVLSNLTKAAGAPSDADLDHLLGLLDAAALPDEASDALRQAFAEPCQHPVDFEVLRARDEALALLMDLVALAHRDGACRDAERRYLRLVARRIGVPGADADAMVG
jgi:hypothetical protein